MTIKAQRVIAVIVLIILIVLLAVNSRLSKQLSLYTGESSIGGTYVLNGDQMAKDAEYLAFESERGKSSIYWRYIQLNYTEEGTYKKNGHNQYVLSYSDVNGENKEVNILLIKDTIYLFDNVKNKIFTYKKLGDVTSHV